MQDVRKNHSHLASPAQRFGAWVLDAVIGGLLISPLVLAWRAGPDGGPGDTLWILAVVEIIAFAYLIGFDGGQRGALRRVGYVLGYLAVLVGWLWLLIDRHHRTWHDLLAKTIVVRTR